MSSPLSYCRFCAERKPDNFLIDLQTELTKRNSIIERLSLFSELLVNLDNESLGAHVCVPCYGMLESCEEWVARVKQSQQLLGALSVSKTEVKVEVEDCEALEEAVNAWAAYPWSCGHCAATLPSMDALREHSKTAHQTCFGFKCADCEVRVPTVFSDFVAHVRVHRYELRKYCEYCNMKMEDNTHKELHNNRDRCEQCGGNEHNKPPYITVYEPEVIVPQTYQSQLENFIEELIVDSLSESQDILLPTVNQCKLKTVTQPKLNGGSKSMLQNTLPQPYNSPKTRNIEPKFFKSALEQKPVPSTIKNWKSYPLYCQFCNHNELTRLRCGVLKSRCTFIRHVVKEHKKCFGMRCVDCPETQDTYLQFTEHVRKHRPELKNLCPYCDCNLDENDTTHIKKHELNDFLCVQCGKIYKNAGTLRLHQLQTHTPFIKPPEKRARKTAEDLTCNICHIQFHKSAIKYHRQTHLANRQKILCDTCGKSFYSVVYLSQHMQVHDETAIETCKICNKTVRRHCLKSHVKTHYRKKEFQCDICKQFFWSKMLVRNHIQRHSDIKKYKCSYCGKRFRHHKVLNTHIYQHTGARPYKCDSCDRTFVNWSNCNSHMKRMHGTTLAKYTHTPHGKIALNMETMTPINIVQDKEALEWGRKVLENKVPGKKKKEIKTDE